YEYGVKSCFHNDFGLTIAKIGLGVAVLFLCSYITLPLYALIAQMGSNMKKSIFDEQTSKALKKWHMAVKKKKHGGKSPTRVLGGNASPTSSSMAGSPFHPASATTNATLHRFKTTGHSSRSHDEHDGSDIEDPSTPTPPTASLILRASNDDDLAAHGGQEIRNEDDFSFVKPGPNNK
ncbi:hypothetical protein MIMGU_mgv1a0064622mg, partial [Erythranthe guttata]